MNKLNAQTIIRQLDSSIWIFSAPFFRYNLFPVGGRSTAIRLQSGGIWLLASTPLNQVTKSKLGELGNVKYIIAPDIEHHTFAKDYKAAYPDAKLIGVEGHKKKYPDGSLKFDGAYGSDPEGTKYGFEDEIEAVYFSSHRSQDVAFFHKETKTLVEADLLFNLPAREQHSKAGGFNLLSGLALTPYGGFHKNMVKSLCMEESAYRKAATAVANWDFKRIIPCHGDVIETDGNKAWREAYKHFID